MPNDCAVLIRSTLHYARSTAAVEEMLGNGAVAHGIYEAGIKVLAYVLDSEALSERDKAAVQRYCDAFAERSSKAQSDASSSSASADAVLVRTPSPDALLGPCAGDGRLGPVNHTRHP